MHAPSVFTRVNHSEATLINSINQKARKNDDVRNVIFQIELDTRNYYPVANELIHASNFFLGIEHYIAQVERLIKK